MIYLFYDYETTGFSPTTDKLIEIAAVITNANFKVVDTFNTLVNPGKWISPKITEITSITNEMVKGAPTEEMAFREFIDFINKYQPTHIAGHNILKFDNKWTAERLKRYKLNMHQPEEYIDTLDIFSSLGKEGKLEGYKYTTKAGNPSYKLENLIDYYELGGQSHRALDDVMKNILVFKKSREMDSVTKDLGF